MTNQFAEQFEVKGGRYDGLALMVPCNPNIGIPPDGTPIRFQTAMLEEASGNLGTKLPRFAFFVNQGRILIPCGFSDHKDGPKLPDPKNN